MTAFKRSTFKPFFNVALMASLLALGVAGTLASRPAAADQQGDHRGFEQRGGRRFFDNRYNHGRYYPSRGAFFRFLPGGYRTFYYGGRPFFFAGGVWYAAGPGGYVVAAPPFGLRVSVLPPFYTTVWFGGVPYYYADDVYYQWDAPVGAYQVVGPPPGADAQPDPNEAAPPPDAGAPGEPPPPGAPPGQGQEGQEQPAPAPPSPSELYAYPKNGQSTAQQSQDRYQCHTWASGQTGFDPTRSGGGVPPDQNASKSVQYRRAMTACLTARGYSVD